MKLWILLNPKWRRKRAVQTLPEDAVAAVSARRQSAEPKALFALDVRQHKREVLPDMINCQAGGSIQKKHRHRL